jgi:hypothetical protein
MPSQHGFQSNTTIHAAYWRYVPDPNAVPPGKEIFVEINGIQFIEASADRKKCWIYYAASDVSVSQRPFILDDDAATTFLSDMEALFV